MRPRTKKIEIEVLGELVGIDMERIQAACTDLFERMRPLIGEILEQIIETKTQLAAVVFAGGSSSLQQFQQVVKDEIKTRHVHVDAFIDMPESETVAREMQLSGEGRTVATDVLSRDVGIEVTDDSGEAKMSVLLKRNNPYPASAERRCIKLKDPKPTSDSWRVTTSWLKTIASEGLFNIATTKGEEFEVEIHVRGREDMTSLRLRREVAGRALYVTKGGCTLRSRSGR